MAGVKGYLPEKYFSQKNNYESPQFEHPIIKAPTKISTTTEAIIQDIITTAAESTSKITGIIGDIFTNSNNTQDVAGTNNTIIDETVKSNGTFNTADVNMTADAGFTVDSLRTTTQSLSDWVLDNVTSTSGYDVREDGNLTSSEHDMYSNHHDTSFVIMGVLIGILIVIGIGLIAVYVLYRKKNRAHISGHHSQTTSEIPTSSMRDLTEVKVNQQKH